MMRDAPLPQDITARLASLGEALGRRPDVGFAYLFGSAATGRTGPLSDVDVAVYLDDGTADPETARLEVLGAINRHLGTDRVDLVVLNTAPTALAGRILQTRRVVCDRQPFLRHRFESRTLRMFFDFRVMEHRILTRRFARG